MRTCLYYLLVEPVREGFRDTHDAEPALSVPVEGGSRKCQLAVFVDETSRPALVRISIPDLAEDAIPEEIVEHLQTWKEHLLTVLRLTYHPTASFFPRPLWYFVDADKPYAMGIDLELVGAFPFDHERAKRLFIAGFDARLELHLLADVRDPRLPLQYRFLSFYKLIELEFKSGQHWLKKDLETFLAPFAAQLCGSTSQKPAALLHRIRDRCAHIHAGRGTGVTHLDQVQAARVEGLLPTIEVIAGSLVNRRGKGKLTVVRVGA
jgi:hypothetical protein